MADLEFKLTLKSTYDFKKKLTGLSQYVNKYVFEHMTGPLNKIEERLIKYVYTVGPTKRTGTLGHSVIAFRKKINQYNSSYGWLVDTDIAPYAEIFIGKPSTLTLEAKKKQFMRWHSSLLDSWVSKRKIEITHRANPDDMDEIFETNVSYDIRRLANTAVRKFVRER